MDRLQLSFQSEAADILEALEASLLALDDSAEPLAEIDAAFRSLHTLKGSGAMVGFVELERFAHSLESAFDAVRGGERHLDAKLTSLALASLDHLRTLVAVGPTPYPEHIRASDTLLSELAQRSATPRPTSTGVDAEDSPVATGWLITLSPEPELLQDGLDPVSVLEGFESLGSTILAGFCQDVAPLETLEPGHLHLSWRVLLVSEASIQDIEDVLFFVQDRALITVTKLADGVCLARLEGADSGLRSALERGSQDELQSIFQSTVAPETTSQDDGEPLLAPQDSVPIAPSRPPGSVPFLAKEDMIKVPASKLDVMVDLVGEMVIAQARLSEVAGRYHDPDLHAVAEDLERMCANMRDSTMDLRMLPIGTTFSRFKRLVRDVSVQLGKQIQLVTAGEDTELDKTVIDKLGDPMVHLIRNCLDHGIEDPETRRAAGKPEQGTIWLSARHSEASVIVEVRDDGHGVDPDRIRARAVERGLIDASANLTEEEIQHLIFEPGFSTASSVSALSGRGVGMDAVRSAVRDLRGDIRLSSRIGEGTTLRIQLPLTLAIIEGLLVELGRSRYVLPLSQVEECIEVPPQGPGFTELRGELVPFFDLGEWFEIDSAGTDNQQIIITNVDGHRFGFLVDDVVGQQQTVIKSLGQAYEGVEGISGATILGNGDVALILDPKKIAHAVARAN